MDFQAVIARASGARPDRRARAHQRPGLRAREALRGRRGRPRDRDRRLLDRQRAAPREPQRQRRRADRDPGQGGRPRRHARRRGRGRARSISRSRRCSPDCARARSIRRSGSAARCRTSSGSRTCSRCASSPCGRSPRRSSRSGCREPTARAGRAGSGHQHRRPAGDRRTAARSRRAPARVAAAHPPRLALGPAARHRARRPLGQRSARPAEGGGRPNSSRLSAGSPRSSARICSSRTGDLLRDDQAGGGRARDDLRARRPALAPGAPPPLARAVAGAAGRGASGHRHPHGRRPDQAPAVERRAAGGRPGMSPIDVIVVLVLLVVAVAAVDPAAGPARPAARAGAAADPLPVRRLEPVQAGARCCPAALQGRERDAGAGSADAGPDDSPARVAPQPRQAAAALPVLEAIEQRALNNGVPVDSRIERGRSTRHALPELTSHERYDRIVVSADSGREGRRPRRGRHRLAARRAAGRDRRPQAGRRRAARRR